MLLCYNTKHVYYFRFTMCKRMWESQKRMITECVSCGVSFLKETLSDSCCRDCLISQDILDDIIAMEDLQADQPSETPFAPGQILLSDLPMSLEEETICSPLPPLEDLHTSDSASDTITVQEISPMPCLYPKDTTIVISPKSDTHPAKETSIAHSYDGIFERGNLLIEVAVSITLRQKPDVSQVCVFEELPIQLRDMYLHLDLPSITPANIFSSSSSPPGVVKTPNQWAQGIANPVTPSTYFNDVAENSSSHIEFAYSSPPT